MKNIQSESSYTGRNWVTPHWQYFGAPILCACTRSCISIYSAGERALSSARRLSYRGYYSAKPRVQALLLPVVSLRAYAASVSLTPRLPRRWNRQLYLYAQLSLARHPATRAASTPFGRPNVYFPARSDFPWLCCRCDLLYYVPNIISFQNF